TDVRGKIALILDGPASGPSSRLEKLIAARHHGAAAVLVVVDRLPSLETTGAPVRIISGAITRSAADLLLAPAGRNLAAFAADRTGGGATSVQARVRVAIEHDERRTANVIGVLPGTDPSLKAEAVGLRAPYDHPGRARGGGAPGGDANPPRPAGRPGGRPRSGARVCRDRRGATDPGLRLLLGRGDRPARIGALRATRGRSARSHRGDAQLRHGRPNAKSADGDRRRGERGRPACAR